MVELLVESPLEARMAESTMVESTMVESKAVEDTTPELQAQSRQFGVVADTSREARQHCLRYWIVQATTQMTA
jgi:hypothetical protein